MSVRAISSEDPLVEVILAFFHATLPLMFYVN